MADNETPTTPATTVTLADFEKAADEYRQKIMKSGAACGPSYQGGACAPVVWYDQLFDFEISPSGTVNCPNALVAGSVQNGLDIVLVASHSNTANVVAASGATVTATLYQSDERDGTFAEVGPTYCVKAPTEGISAEPCHTFVRFPLGALSKQWLKVRLEFSGTISGGKVDVCLGYVPR